MKQFVSDMVNNMGIIGEFLKFLWARRLWWLIPMVVMLLLFGFLLVFANASGIAPFIYTLF
jgi:drug/metabolite transporter superfamily protein YnfA